MLQLSCRLRVLFICSFFLSSALFVFGQNSSKGGPSPVSFSIPFSQSVTGSHVKMGLPLPAGISPRQISLYDAEGMYVQADIFPLKNWPGITQPWALLAFPAISQKGEPGSYTLRFDQVAPPQEEGITREEEADGSMSFSNFFYRITLSSAGIQSLGSASSEPSNTQWKAGILEAGETELPSSSEKGSIELIYDGNLYKKVRLIQPMAQGLMVYQELDLFANSPYVHCQTRILNTHSEDIPISGILPMQVRFEGKVGKSTIGLPSSSPQESSSFTLHQGYYDWLLALSDRDNIRGNEGNLSEWVSLELDNGVKAQWIFPHFQEMAARYPDRESLLSFKNNSLKIHHYKPLSGDQKSSMVLPSGQARSFESWMVINPIEEDWEGHAAICKNMPQVSYDRAYISQSELLPEGAAGSPYDAIWTPIAAQNGKRATWMKNEPFPTPFPLQGLDYGWNIAAQAQLNSSHVSWDLSRVLTQSYLRSGEGEIASAAYNYALLQADRGINRNPLSNLPSGHPSATDQVEGLVAAYHIWGEPWFIESAEIGAKKASGGSRGGNAEAPASLDFSQGNTLGADVSPSEESFYEQALYAYAQTVAFSRSQNTASFYLANAAWLGLVEAEKDAETQEGSLPLIQGLPYFAGQAHKNSLPYVVQAIGEAEGSLSQVLMNPNASWDGKVFSFALVRTPERAESLPAHKGAIDIEVFFPVGKVNSLKVDGEKTAFTHDAGSSILTFSLGASQSQKSYQIEISGR